MQRGLKDTVQHFGLRSVKYAERKRLYVMFLIGIGRMGSGLRISVWRTETKVYRERINNVHESDDNHTTRSNSLA